MNKKLILFSVYTLLMFSLFVSCSEKSREKIIEEVEGAVFSYLNAQTVPDSDSGLELPLVQNKMDLIVHTVNFNGKKIVNYSLEWDRLLKHARWVAFTFDRDTIQWNDSVTRSDKLPLNKGYGFQEDPALPQILGGPVYKDHSFNGADKGHLVASADRFFDQEANNQTFYLTNMSPQLPSFNQHYWNSFEIKGRNLCEGEIAAGANKVYVVKGGDLNHLKKNYCSSEGQSNKGKMYYLKSDENGLCYNQEDFLYGGIALPDYYFMAFLSEIPDQNGGYTYKSLGFYLHHGENMGEAGLEEIKKNACTINYIEEKTGLDLFCNLNDEVEEKIESSLDLSAWNWKYK